MAEFPELAGLEGSPCTQNSWVRVGPVTVEAPYMGLDDYEGALEGLITIQRDKGPAWDMFRRLSRKESQRVGGVGWQSEAEYDVWRRWKQLASATKNNTALYHPDAKGAIVQLAGTAFALLQEINAIYEYHEAFQWPFKDGTTGAQPLFLTEDAVERGVDMANAVNPSLAMFRRREDRTRIQNAYYRAARDLFCALFGVEQSMTWRENRRAYLEAAAKNIEPGLDREEPPNVPPQGSGITFSASNLPPSPGAPPPSTEDPGPTYYPPEPSPEPPPETGSGVTFSASNLPPSPLDPEPQADEPPYVDYEPPDIEEGDEAGIVVEDMPASKLKLALGVGAGAILLFWLVGGDR